MKNILTYLRTSLFLGLISSLISINAVLAEGITPEEVRATYILKMHPFFKVGTPPRSIHNLCYYEKSGIPFRESVGQIIARYYSDHPDDAISVHSYDALRPFSSCDLLYIPERESSNLDNILATVGNNSILTISAVPHFIMKGGMVGFIFDNDNRIKMETNLRNLKARGIQANPQILEIMSQVVD